MSWWPFSSSGTDAQAQSQAQQASSPPMASQPTSAPQPSQPAEAPHDADFYAAHPHLAPPSFSTSSPSNPTTTQPTTSSSAHTASPTPDLNDPSLRHLPRTMSCRDAFDSAYYCSSFGGHFHDIYRYGQLRSCSEHWSDFWFCMRVKNSYNDRETKERMVQDRYREKEERLRAGPNSEDVWSVRAVGEEVERPFGAAKDV